MPNPESGSEVSAYFQPLEVVRAVKEDYLRYLLTTFPVSGELGENLYDRLLNDASPWEGPFITISQPYQRGGTVRNVLAELQMNEHLAGLMPPRFYGHQEKAIRNITAGRNTIITTGTGSGKTEGFLLPILDYCIKHGEPGVKAILLYPMNSLAEDQADRLRKYLYLLNQRTGRRPITFARYTGATPTTWDDRKIGNVRCPLCDMVNTEGLRRCLVCSGKYAGDAELQPAVLANDRRALICAHESPPPVTVEYEKLTREDIRNSPPDIIITNYKMLDLLLLRHEDRNLFTNSLRFIVADELHSYLGAQGTELACLLRRLVSRIRDAGGSDPIFTGASATIVSDTVTDLKRQVAEYASSFFGAPLTETDVFTGAVEERVFDGDECAHVPPADDPGMNLEGSREEFIRIIGSICPQDRIPGEIPDNTEERRLILGVLMQHNSLFRQLTARLRHPRSLNEIEDELKENNPRSNYTSREILRILALATKAYDPSTRNTAVRMPFVRCQVHFVARTLDGVYKCTGCNTLFFSPRFTCPACHGSVETLAVCRSCGAEFLRVDLPEDDYHRYIERRTEDVDRALNATTPWTIRRTGILREPYGFSPPSVWISETDIPSDKTANVLRVQRCVSCGAIKYNNRARCCPDENLRNVWLFRKISTCPFCLDQRGPFAQPVSTLYLSPRTAAPTLFALTHTSTKEAEHRKQLIFSDSRQETARLAGFMDDLHRGILIRNLIHNIVRESSEHGTVSFFDLSRETINRIFGLNYKDDEEDEVFGLDRHKLERQVHEELAGCFSKRYSVEKVGLIKAFYDTIDSENFIRDYNNDPHPLLRRVKELTNSDAMAVRNVLTMMLDYMRHEAGMRCLRNFRQGFARPAAFVEQKTSRRQSLYYSVTGVKRKHRRARGFYNHTVFTKFIQKAFNVTDGDIQNEIAGCLFGFLCRRGLLTREDIGHRRRAQNRGTGWMVDESKVFFGLPDVVHVCPRCGGRSARSAGQVSCFNYYCNERSSITKTRDEILAEDDIYIKRYSEEQPVRLITAEDHGGLDAIHRKKIEAAFKQGQIDAICCTPTLELGVDIGDLSIVGLYRTPPSPANYIQRVGRAGRRERISLAMTFFGQNPIDQYYRRRPLEMIGGNVRLPYVNLENDTIISRHVHSLILEALTVTGGGLQINRRVLDFRNQNQAELLRQTLAGRMQEVQDAIRRTFTGIPWLADWKIRRLCEQFPDAVADAIRKWGVRREMLMTTLDELYEKNREANRAGRTDEAAEYMRRYAETQRQLNEMQGEDRGESDLFSYLSGVGVLPTYTFPVKLVRIQDRWGHDLGNDRPACSAITEFAPGLGVDMRKAKYLVRGFDTTTSPEPTGRTFYLCDTSKGGCGFVTTSMHFSCPVCHSPRDRITEVRAWNPSGLVLEREERISVRGIEEFKVADAEYFLLESETDDNRTREYSTSWAGLRDRGASEVLLLVRRTSNMSDRTGFDICPECGWCMQGEPVQRAAIAAHNKLMDRRIQCTGMVEKRSLWHIFRTNALELVPAQEAVSSSDARRWLVTLKNALCRTAEIMINAAEGELDGFVRNNNSLVIFDNVDGGVGYTRQLANRIRQIEQEMALTVLSCDCETGCPKCIFSSRRKIDVIRGDVDKRLIIPLCQRILRDAMPSRPLPAPVPRREDALEALGVGRVQGNVACWFSAIDDKRPATWLRDLILTAREEICVTSLYITDDRLEWDDSGNGSFAELLNLAAARGLKVRAIVRPPGSEKHRRILKRMRENGVDIRTFSRPSGSGLDAIAHCKMVVVDGNMQSETSTGVTLSANLSAEVQKNVDFFCLGYERQWITGLQHAFEKIWADATQMP